MRRTMLSLTTVVALVAAVLLGQPLLDTAAQDVSTAGHPLVGTWVIDNDTTTDTGAPPVAVFTSDGTFTDAAAGFSGVWEATSETGAVMSFVGILDNQDGFSGYIALTGPIEIDATGDAWDSTYQVMTVAADGTVIETTPPIPSHGERLHVIPEGGLGTALEKVRAWYHAPVATPTS